MAVPWPIIISYIITAVSIAYQVAQQHKMRKAARQAADARKGFEFVVEGEQISLPVIYGRAKVGGARVWHATLSTYTAAPSVNADVYWDPVPPTAGGFLTAVGYVGAISYVTIDRFGNTTPVVRNITTPVLGNLNATQVGNKNQYLYFQQALCHGPINAVYDFIIDDSRFMDDYSLSTGWAAFRTELIYGGSAANNTISVNFGERSRAKFYGIAYASTIVRLNRDDPQFNGTVPQVQYFIEGRKVRRINYSAGNYSLSATRVYDNNPAYCLLDYLILNDDLVAEGKTLFSPGKRLSINDIDLPSFYAAAQICNRVVKTDVDVTGKLWRPTDGSRDIRKRDIPLFECNIVLDPEKTIRENIEAILSTMGDARLVWSEGKYKLNLKYPQEGAGSTNPGPDYPIPNIPPLKPPV
jgi:hypothetical protein